MAINFPSTTGQATDGSFTHAVGNITYRWNGVSWSASISGGGGGSSYDDSSVDAHLNRATAADNEVLSWNGADYDWVAQSSGGSSLSNIADAGYGVDITGKAALTDGIDIDIGGSINAAGTSIDFQNTTISFSGASIGGLQSTINDGVDFHLNNNSISSGKILSWNGSDYAWIDQSSGSGGSIYNTIGLEGWVKVHNAPILFTQALDDTTGASNQPFWLQNYVAAVQGISSNAAATLSTVATGGHNAFTSDTTLQAAIRTAVGSSNPSGAITNAQFPIVPTDNQTHTVDGVSYPVMGKLYVPTGLTENQVDVVVLFHGTLPEGGTYTIGQAAVDMLDRFVSTDTTNANYTTLNIRDKIVFSVAYPQDHIPQNRQFNLTGVGTEQADFLLGDNLPYARAAVGWVQNSLDAYIAAQGGSKTIGNVYLFGHSQGGKLVAKINTLDTGITGVVSNSPGPIHLDQTCAAQPGGTSCSKISAIHGYPVNVTITDSSSGGSSTFTGLTDTPSSLTADKWLKVNSAANALEFVDSPSGGSGTLTVATSNAAREYNYNDLPGTATAYGLNTAANVAPQNTPTYTNTDGYTFPISNPVNHPDPVSLAFDGRTDTYTVVASSIDGGVVELVFTNPIAVGNLDKLVLGFDGNIECGFNGGNYVTASGATGNVTELTVSSTANQTLNKLTFKTPTASGAVGNLYYVIASFGGSQSRLRIKETDISVGSSGTGDNQLIMHDSSVVIHLTPSEVNKVVAVKTDIPRQIILPAGALMTPGDTVTVIDVGHGPYDRDDTNLYPFATPTMGFPYYTYNSGNSSYAPILIYPDRDDGVQGTNIQPWNSGNSITVYGTAQNGGKYVTEPFHGMPFAINKNGGSIKLMWIGPSYGWRVLP